MRRPHCVWSRRLSSLYLRSNLRCKSQVVSYVPTRGHVARVWWVIPSIHVLSCWRRRRYLPAQLDTARSIYPSLSSPMLLWTCLSSQIREIFRLHGAGVIDIKTRAALPIRVDVLNYEVCRHGRTWSPMSVCGPDIAIGCLAWVYGGRRWCHLEDGDGMSDEIWDVLCSDSFWRQGRLVRLSIWRTPRMSYASLCPMRTLDVSVSLNLSRTLSRFGRPLVWVWLWESWLSQ